MLYYPQVTEVLKNAIAEDKTVQEAVNDILKLNFARPYEIFITVDDRLVYGVANKAQAFVKYLTTMLVKVLPNKKLSDILDLELAFNRIQDNNEIDYFEFTGVDLGTNILLGEAIDNSFEFCDLDSIVSHEGQWIRFDETAKFNRI